MSYDIWLEANLGGGEAQQVGDLDWNYTYNIQPMTARAGLHSLNDLDGMNAGAALNILVPLIVRLETAPEDYRALNPSNGWGDYDSFLRALYRLRDAFAAAPHATVRVA